MNVTARAASGASAAAHLRPDPRPLPLHDARGLTGAEGIALILLDGQVYTLRITRAGKLILTK